MNNSDFIQQLAGWVLDTFEGRTDGLNIVFPNKRAGLFLRQELVRKAKKAIWMPQIYSIEEIFGRWAGIQQADPLSLILDLMDFESRTGTPNPSFLSYAAQLVKEFDEIDHHLAETKALFAYLSEAKALELWHPDGSQLTTYEQNYLRFFQSFGEYYAFLHSRMGENKAASSGAIARQLATMETPALLARTENRFTVFAGFNAFSPAEEKIVLTLIENNLAELRWDFDTYYINENRFGFHEAGASFRRLRKRNRQISEEWTGNKLLGEKKDIFFVAAAGQVGQAKAMGEILNRLPDNNNGLSTAVVLADENMIFPVLNSIPDKLGVFNVTMGLPFVSSQAFSLLMAVMSLEKRMSRRQKPETIPLSQLLSIIQHDLVFASINMQAQSAIIRFGAQLLSEGNPYVSPTRFGELATAADPFLGKLIEQLTKPAVTSEAQLEKHIELFRLLGQQIALLPNADAMVMASNQTIIAQRLLLQALKIAKQYPNVPATLWVEPLLRQLAANQSMAFIGEPLEGLQLMGLLESRNLSFDTVHLLAANEGILPRNTHQHSLIPSDIRTTFGLPTRNDSQSVFAFHFFHLIQNASTIYLYYNAEGDEFGKGEMSRFLLQIKHELKVLNPQISITEMTFALKAEAQSAQRTIAIEKSPQIIEKIRQRMTNGLSPTSISRFLSCPLKFCLNDILGIKEPDPADSGITFRQMGNIVHRTIENLYKPFLNQTLSKEMIKMVMTNADDQLREAFDTELPGVGLEEGMNKINFMVAQRFVNNLLNADMETVKNGKLIISQQEKQLEWQVEALMQSVKIKGTIDRIDMINNVLRIIDYKTGKTEQNEIRIDDKEGYNDLKKAKGLQLALYSWLWLKNNEGSPIFPEAFLFSLSKASGSMIEARLPHQGNVASFCDDVDTFLTETATAILDPLTTFGQTADDTACGFCPYANICRRGKKSTQWV